MEAVKPQKQDTSVNVVSVTGLEPIAAGPSLGGSSALLSQPDRRRAAERLREKGWSYRRIAEDLGVPYILVSKWLSDDPVLPDVPPQPRADAGRPVSEPPVAPSGEHEDSAEIIETLKLQYAALERYMLPMMEALERSRLADTDGAEARAREATEQRISELETAVAALQDQVRILAVSTAAAGAVAAMTVTDTVVTPSTDPFAEAPDALVDSTPDPFADESPDPFADAALDPFADLSDPEFIPEPAATPSADTTADPFASAAVTDPFEAGEAPDPFAELTDPFGEVADPFADVAAPGSLSEAPDPFAETATEPDPFADPPAEPDASAPKSLGARLKFWKR